MVEHLKGKNEYAFESNSPSFHSPVIQFPSLDAATITSGFLLSSRGIEILCI